MLEERLLHLLGHTQVPAPVHVASEQEQPQQHALAASLQGTRGRVMGSGQIHMELKGHPQVGRQAYRQLNISMLRH